MRAHNSHIQTRRSRHRRIPVLMGRVPFINFLNGIPNTKWWHGQELSGNTIINTDPALNGVYSAVTLAKPAQGRLGLGVGYNGSTSRGNVYSAALNTFLDGAEGSLMTFVKLNPTAWITGLAERILYLNTTIGTANRFILQKSGVNGELSAHRIANNINSSVTVNAATTGSTPDYFLLALTWNKVLDRVRVNFKGDQIGADVNGLGVFSGVLLNTESNIGANDAGPTLVVDGDIDHVGISDRELTQAELRNMWDESGLS